MATGVAAQSRSRPKPDPISFTVLGPALTTDAQNVFQGTLAERLRRMPDTEVVHAFNIVSRGAFEMQPTFDKGTTKPAPAPGSTLGAAARAEMEKVVFALIWQQAEHWDFPQLAKATQVMAEFETFVRAV